MDRALDRAHETGAHTNAIGTKGESRHQSACISKATGSDQRDLQHVSRCRDQNKSRDIVFAGVPSTFEAVDRNHKGTSQKDRLSIVGIFQRRLIATTLQTSLMMAAFMFSYYSIIFWYPTFLRDSKLPPLLYLVVLNVGGVMGTVLWGRASETKLGRRGAISLAALIGVLVIPIFVASHVPMTLLLGGFLTGSCAIGIFGVAPAYLSERFPTAARAVGPGISWHAGAAVGSLTPTFIGALQDRGVPLPGAMGVCMAVAGVLVIAMMWLGPETRGRSFNSLD